MNNSIKLKSGRELPLLNLKGKDYLPVAYRLVWFREEHPDWSITTEFVYQDDKSALAKATIHGRGTGPHALETFIIATSHKEESRADFPLGYREKAETGAIGRALALCGYGTQFEPEFDEGSRIVDSPVGGSRVIPDQPGPNDGIQEDGVLIKYDHPNKKYAALVGRFVHKVDPALLRDYIIDYEAIWSARGLSEPPVWAREMVKAAEEHIGKFENEDFK